MPPITTFHVSPAPETTYAGGFVAKISMVSFCRAAELRDGVADEAEIVNALRGFELIPARRL